MNYTILWGKEQPNYLSRGVSFLFGYYEHNFGSYTYGGPDYNNATIDNTAYWKNIVFVQKTYPVASLPGTVLFERTGISDERGYSRIKVLRVDSRGITFEISAYCYETENLYVYLKDFKFINA
jgi:hypothetical protein